MHQNIRCSFSDKIKKPAVKSIRHCIHRAHSLDGNYEPRGLKRPQRRRSLQQSTTCCSLFFF